MKMAKASADDLRRVREFFEMLEEACEHGTYTADEEAEPQKMSFRMLEDLMQNLWNEGGPGVGTSWRRVVHGCQMLIDNCCDPDADTLEFRPDIAFAMEAGGVSDEIPKK